MNKFEQLSSPGHPMSLAGAGSWVLYWEGQGWSPVQGGLGPGPCTEGRDPVWRGPMHHG